MKNNTRHNKTHQKKTPLHPTPKARPYIWIVVLLLFATTLSHSPSLKNGFLVNWDDDGYILNNSTVHELNPKTVSTIFSDYHMGNYHPLTTLYFAVEYKFFGTNPRPYHVSNLLLHLANVLLVFFFIKLLTQNNSMALITAAIFALHPMHVESVAWISGRKDVLYTLFFMTALISYVKYTTEKKPVWYIFALAAFALSLMSKSAAVVLPLVLVLIDYFMSLKFSIRNTLEKLPFFAFSLLFGVIAIQSQDAQAQQLTPDQGIIQGFFVAAYATGLYLIKFLIPLGLTAYYAHPLLSSTDLPALYYAAPLITLGAVTLLWRFYKEPRLWITGLLFFFFTIALVLQFFPVGGAVAAERYTYVPYIGLGFVLAGITLYITRLYPNFKTPLTVIIVTVLTIFAGMTYSRTSVWKDGISLFDDVIEKDPEAFYAWHSRGIAHYYAGDYLKSLHDYDKATSLNNSYGLTFYNKGLTQLVLKRNEDALNSFSRAIELMPDYAQAYNDRAIAYYNLGRSAEAIADYDKAILLNPNNSSALYNRGIGYFRMQDTTRACADWSRASDSGLRQANELFVKYCK